MGAQVSCLKRSPTNLTVTTSPSTPTAMNMPDTPTTYVAPTHFMVSVPTHSMGSVPVHDVPFSMQTKPPQNANARALIRLTALIKRLSSMSGQQPSAPSASSSWSASTDVTRVNAPSPYSNSRSISSQRPSSSTALPPPLYLTTDFSQVDAALTDCVNDTPTGAAANKYKHFCPICYRHFAEIYVTACCHQNICHVCMLLHIGTKMGGEEERMTVPCPSCNTEGCAFDRVQGAVSSRVYDESPKTKVLLAKLSSTNNPPTTTARRLISPTTPRSLVRHRSDPASALTSQLYLPSSPLQTAFALDPLNLKRIQSIPEHNQIHRDTGETATVNDIGMMSPSFSSPAPPPPRRPAMFSFASAVPVAAS